LSYLRVPPDIPVTPPAEVAATHGAAGTRGDDLSDFDSSQLLDPNATRNDEHPVGPPAVGPSPTPPGRSAGTGTERLRAGEANRSNPAGRPAAVQTQPGGSGSHAEGLPPAETTEVLDESSGVPVPSFEGRTVRAFVQECLRLGLSPVPVGAGVAVEQSPPAGTRVRTGSRILVRFAASAAVHAISQNRN